MLPWPAPHTLARSWPLSTQAFSVITLDGAATVRPSYAVAVNGRGDVLGEDMKLQEPFLYRNGATTFLESPLGVENVSPTDINNNDVISVQARGKNGSPLAFAVQANGSSSTWIPLKTKTVDVENISVSRVAADGDIDGGFDSVTTWRL